MGLLAIVPSFFWNSFDFFEIVLTCSGIVVMFLGTALGILCVALGSRQGHHIKRPRQPLRYSVVFGSRPARASGKVVAFYLATSNTLLFLV